MGDAKRRGTFEQRAELARQRKAAEAPPVEEKTFETAGTPDEKAEIAKQIVDSFSARPKKGSQFKTRDGVEYAVLPSGSFKRLTPKKRG